MSTGWNGTSISSSPVTLFDPATDGHCASIRIANTGGSSMVINIAGLCSGEGLAAGAEVVKRNGSAGIGKVTATSASGTTSDGGVAAIL
jgi:hypothetical protein